MIMSFFHLVCECRADSVAWNPHKALHVPLQCSAFLTRHDDILRSMLSLHASYLFQKDKVLYDVSLDTGDMSLQCGRVNDAFKIWLMWKKNVSSDCDRILFQSSLHTGLGMGWQRD